MSTLFRWIGGVGPDWDSVSGTITNWLNISDNTMTIVPTADTGDVAVFDDGGIHTVGGGGSADEFSITQDTTVTFTEKSFTAGAFTASDNADFPFDLIVSDGGKLIVASGAQLQSQGTVDVIGESGLFGSGSGSLEVDAGGAYGTQGLILGDNTDGNGVVTINNAAGFTVVAPVIDASGDGELIIGNAGTGSLDVTGTPVVFTESAALGVNQGAVGFLTLDSSIWGGGDVTIGAAGTGHATIGAGATVALHNFVVGSAASASGDLTVTGANSFTTDFLTIGAAGTGTATFGADSTAAFGTVTVGESVGAIANMTLDGSLWNTSFLTIGATGTGDVTAGDGEVVTVFGKAVLGQSDDASGDLTVDGAALNGGTLAIGQDGTGDLEIGSGSSGTVTAVVVGEDQGSSGTLTIDDSNWNVGSLTIGDVGTGQVTVGTGAAATIGKVLIGHSGNLAVTETAGSVGTVIAQQVMIDFGTLDLSAFGQVLIGAAEGTNGAVAIGNNSSLKGLGLVEGDVALSNGGVVEATAAAPGALKIDGNVHGTGTIQPLMTLEVNGGIDSGVEISFSPSIGAQVGDLILDVPAANLGTIVDFGIGNTIDLHGSLFNRAVFVQGTSSTPGTLTLSGSVSPSLSFAVEGTYTPDAFTATPGGTDTIVTLCFVMGTRIATPRGEVPVEQLAVGDPVLTVGGAVRPIVWIGVGKVLATRGRRTAATPVIVRKSALADNVPHHDLRVTKGHALLIEGVLIPVEFLVNHRSILWDDRAQEVALYHIELENHDVLLANGAAAESYRDDGNRWLFRNANSGWNAPPKPPYAPVHTGGVLVDAIWRRLLERTGPRCGTPLTDDPDLHLLVNGQRVEPASRQAVAFVFHIPRGPGSVRLVSRAGSPAELGLARDPRVLGVAIRRLVVRQGTRFRIIEAASAELTDGFHAFEPELNIRWTDGVAGLPATWFVAPSGPSELVVHLGGTTRYPLLGESRRGIAA